MKRKTGSLGILSASLLLSCLSVAGSAAAAGRLDEFIGSKVCQSCHTDHYKGWATTAHNQILRVGGNEKVFINDGNLSGKPDFFDGGEIDIRDLPGGDAFMDLVDPPLLGMDPVNGAYAKIGGVVYDIHMTLGGSAVQSAKVADTDKNGVHNGEAQWRQLYLAKIGTARYALPFQFNAKTGEYVPYHLENWYDAGGAALPIDRNTVDYDQAYERGCAGCHSTGVQVARSTKGEWSMSYTDVGVACESCHGPGRKHVEAADADKKANIVNPATLITAEDLDGDGTAGTALDNMTVQNGVCNQCHQQGTGLYSADGTPETTLAYPSMNASGKPALYRPGQDLADYFQVSEDPNLFWGLQAGGFMAAAGSMMQGVEHAHGPHAPDKSYDHACFTCHNLHSTQLPHLIATTIDSGGGVEVPNNGTQRNTLCLACHATHGDFAGITKDQVTQAQGSAADPATAAAQLAVKDEVRAHVKGRAFMDVSFETRCTSCHMPPAGKSAIEGDLRAHVFEPIWPGYVQQPGGFEWAGFFPWWESNESFEDPLDGTEPHASVGPMPDSCTTCHAHDPNAVDEDNIVTQWAKSGHGDGFAEPWNHWNGDASISSSCARCHSAYGYRQLADSSDPVTGIPPYTLNAAGTNPTFTAVTTQSNVYPKVLNCEGCHEPNGGGMTLYEAGKLQQVAFPSGALKTLGNSSNLCIQCHQGRESGKSIPSCSATTGNCSVPSEHYLPEAATFFGTEVTAGYEYSPKLYAGKEPFSAHRQIGKQDCMGCHINKKAGYEVKKEHDFMPQHEECGDCHWDADLFAIDDFEDIGRPFGYPNVDYDGDGVGESFRAEMDGLMDELVLALNVYAKSVGRPALIFVDGQTSLSIATCYPQDASCTDYAATTEPPTPYAVRGGVSNYDLRMVKAAYNWNAARDRAAAIHNYKYIMQTMYDSIEDMDPTLVAGLTRP